MSPHSQTPPFCSWLPALPVYLLISPKFLPWCLQPVLHFLSSKAAAHQPLPGSTSTKALGAPLTLTCAQHRSPACGLSVTALHTTRLLPSCPWPHRLSSLGCVFFQPPLDHGCPQGSVPHCWSHTFSPRPSLPMASFPSLGPGAHICFPESLTSASGHLLGHFP